MNVKKISLLLLFILIHFTLITCDFILTDEVILPDPPKPVTLEKPKSIFANGVLLKWSKAASGNFITYKVFYDTISNVTAEKSMWAGSISNIKNTEIHIENLLVNTKYFIKVYAYYKDISTYSNTINFTTLDCSCGKFTGSTEDDMVKIPAGCFVGKDGFISSITNDYYMDTTEVTAKEWYEVMNDSTISSKKPIVAVSWYEILLFSNKKSKINNLDTCYTYSKIVIDTNTSQIKDILEIKCNFLKNGYRLPTEDEWEYAYKAGQSEEYHWGKDGKTLPHEPWTTKYPKKLKDTLEICKYAWWAYNNKDTLNWYTGLKDVALLKPNPWSLYDIAGNVYEFVWDIHTLERPKNRTNYAGPDFGPLTGKARIARGGVYNYVRPFLLTAWYRGEIIAPENNVESGVGFRLVRTVVD